MPCVQSTPALPACTEAAQLFILNVSFRGESNGA